MKIAKLAAALLSAGLSSAWADTSAQPYSVIVDASTMVSEIAYDDPIKSFSSAGNFTWMQINGTDTTRYEAECTQNSCYKASSPSFWTVSRASHWERLDVNSGDWLYEWEGSGKKFGYGRHRNGVSYHFSSFVNGKTSCEELKNRDISKLSEVKIGDATFTKFEIFVEEYGLEEKNVDGKLERLCSSVSYTVNVYSPEIELGVPGKIYPQKTKCLSWKTGSDGKPVKNSVSGKYELEDVGGCEFEYIGPSTAYIGDTVKYALVRNDKKFSFSWDHLPPVKFYDSDGDQVGEFTQKLRSRNLDTLKLSYYKNSEGNDSIERVLYTSGTAVVYKPMPTDAPLGKVYGAEYLGISDAYKLMFKVKPNDGYMVDESRLSAEYIKDLTLSIFNFSTTANVDNTCYLDQSDLYVCQVAAAKNQPLNTELMVTVKFKESDDALNVVLNKQEHATYTFMRDDFEYTSSRTEDTTFLSSILCSKFVIKAKADDGYVLGSPEVRWRAKTAEEGEFNDYTPKLSLDSVDSEGFSYFSRSICLLRKDFVENQKVFVDVPVKKLSKITAAVEGGVADKVQLMVNGEVCTALSFDGQTEKTKPCYAVEGDEVKIVVVERHGYEYVSATCKSDDELPCSLTMDFIMPNKDVSIKVDLLAKDYELQTDLGLNVDYFNANSEKITGPVHVDDSIYVVAGENGKMIAGLTVKGGDSDEKVDVVYLGGGVWAFQMPAEDVSIVGSVAESYKVTFEYKGKGKAAFMVVYGDNLFEEYSLTAGSYFEIVPQPDAGYAHDSTLCDLDGDMAQLDSKTVMMDAHDLKCKVYFSAINYVITKNVIGEERGSSNVAATAIVDEKVSLTVDVLEDYTMDFVNVYYKTNCTAAVGAGASLNCDSVFVATTSSKTGNVYTYNFTMPAHDLNIDVAYKSVESSCSSAEPESASSSGSKPKSSSANGSVIPGSSSSVKATSSSSKKASSSSAKAASSSSKKRSSSSSVKAACSSSKKTSSSSAKKDAVVATAKMPMFSVAVMGRNVQIAGASAGAKVAVFDMQGGLISAGRVDSANFNVAMPRSGSYMVRVGSQVQRVNVK